MVEINVNIGLSLSVRQQMTQNLSLLLADTYILYFKIQHFRWNLTDPRFYSLSFFLKEEYAQLNEGIEEIAKRIRSLGEYPPSNLKQFLNMTSLKETDDNLLTEDMLINLANDHEAICRFLRDRIVLASKLEDEGTAALFVQRLCAHEKSAWMLRSQLS